MRLVGVRHHVRSYPTLAEINERNRRVLESLRAGSETGRRHEIERLNLIGARAQVAQEREIAAQARAHAAARNSAEALDARLKATRGARAERFVAGQAARELRAAKGIASAVEAELRALKRVERAGDKNRLKEIRAEFHPKIKAAREAYFETKALNNAEVRDMHRLRRAVRKDLPAKRGTDLRETWSTFELPKRDLLRALQRPSVREAR
jgi:hypothetical protein